MGGVARGDDQGDVQPAHRQMNQTFAHHQFADSDVVARGLGAAGMIAIGLAHLLDAPGKFLPITCGWRVSRVGPEARQREAEYRRRAAMGDRQTTAFSVCE